LKELVVRGKVWKYGNDIDTDAIIPGKYMALKSLEEQIPHTMEGIDPSFAQKVQAGDIIVAGKNFGCGSSRETAATLIKACGVSAIIAESFSRIFFRNAINQALLVVECKGIFNAVEEGDEVVYESSSGLITNTTKAVKLSAAGLPDFLLSILQDGGAIQNFRKRHRSVKP
jgi:3-isopropylmalate/(R)-2-methylmalate dehydratase small subunit